MNIKSRNLLIVFIILLGCVTYSYARYVAPLSITTIVAAVIEDTITNGTTDKAPTSNAVFDALALKAPLASPTFTGTVTTPATASRALITGASSELAAATTTATEIGYVNGVTSAIQTQMDTKAAGAASSTDNAVCRFDSTTGKIIQNSVVTVADTTGAIKVNLPASSGYVNVLDVSADTGTVPAILFSDNSGEGGLAFRRSSDTGIMYRARVSGVFGAQNGYTVDARSEFKITIDGAIKPGSETSNPCADTTNNPEGSLFWNDTSNYFCFCPASGGAAVQMHSPATACF